MKYLLNLSYLVKIRRHTKELQTCFDLYRDAIQKILVNRFASSKLGQELIELHEELGNLNSIVFLSKDETKKSQLMKESLENIRKLQLEKDNSFRNYIENLELSKILEKRIKRKIKIILKNAEKVKES